MTTHPDILREPEGICDREFTIKAEFVVQVDQCSEEEGERKAAQIFHRETQKMLRSDLCDYEVTECEECN